MTSIFVTGLFYNDGAEEEEDDKDIWESLSAFSWTDFWIIIYSTSITVPVPLVLRFFFRRKTIDSTLDVEIQLKNMKTKRILGYIVVTGIVLWCSWSCIAFSLDFGYNKTQ